MLGETKDNPPTSGVSLLGWDLNWGGGRMEFGVTVVYVLLKNISNLTMPTKHTKKYIQGSKQSQCPVPIKHDTKWPYFSKLIYTLLGTCQIILEASNKGVKYFAHKNQAT